MMVTKIIQIAEGPEGNFCPVTGSREGDFFVTFSVPVSKCWHSSIEKLQLAFCHDVYILHGLLRMSNSINVSRGMEIEK
jgi:hypothetical protein